MLPDADIKIFRPRPSCDAGAFCRLDSTKELLIPHAKLMPVCPAQRQTVQLQALTGENSGI